MQAQTVQTIATIAVPDPSAFTVPDVHYERGLGAPQIVGPGEGGVLTYIPQTVRREVNLRDDPFGQMYKRGTIGRAQYQAGRKFQSTWEAAGTPLRSPGNIIEHVDGGRGASDGITDRRMAAGKDLALWRSELGRDGYSLIQAVLIDKRTIREVADSGAMMPGKAATTYYGHAFRRQLSLLAKVMGFG